MAASLYGAGDTSIVRDGVVSYKIRNKKFKDQHVRLFKNSENGVPRLEMYDSKKNYLAGKYFLIIPGSDVLSVRESTVGQSGHDKFCFVISTKTDQHFFRADDEYKLQEWIKVAITVLLRSGASAYPHIQNKPTNAVTEENDLYESADEFLREFRVTVGAETRQRLGFDGNVRLLVENGHITLIDLSGVRIARWGIEHLRRFGYKDNDFHIEAGRKSALGEGHFLFVTDEGKQIHNVVAKEKKLCREKNKMKLGSIVKTATLPGQITSTKVKESDIPYTTGGHDYESVELEKVPPSKPTRNPQTTLSLNSAGTGEGQAMNFNRTKSQPTHTGRITLNFQQHKPNVMSRINFTNDTGMYSEITPASPSKTDVSPNNSAIYSEVELITDAWKTHGVDEKEELCSNSSQSKTDDEYDTLYRVKNEHKVSEEDIYSEAHAPGRIYQNQEMLQKIQQQSPPKVHENIIKSEPIYATVIKSSERNKHNSIKH